MKTKNGPVIDLSVTSTSSVPDKRSGSHKINGLLGPIENEEPWQVRITSLKGQAHFGTGKLL